ncbi:uncharacterized protein LOC114351446 [Ostrinia furnacalis]|uniref:uncharacterized protein LOC114351446 n=1 Tax=Ostrinia furnacalis TaxID=93504 RepID=UPI001039AAFA|nr:uncharacterized protein LOC114351446 [Ostrinia furnacalis]
MELSSIKMFFSMNYFKNTDDEKTSNEMEDTVIVQKDETKEINFDRAEPDSTSKQCGTSSNLPDSETSQKNCMSESDVALSSEGPSNEQKTKKLKLDINKARLLCEAIDDTDSSPSSNVENTPKQVWLKNESEDGFKFRSLDFDKSYDIYEMSESSSLVEEENLDEESSDRSDISVISADNEEIKMCRKVEPEATEDYQRVQSASAEPFADIEVEKNEEERIMMLLEYQMNLQKLDCILKKVLSEFQFQIEVSKVFHCRSIVTTLPGTDITNIPNTLGEITYIDNLDRGVSPSGSWNIVMEKEDDDAKLKLKKQLSSMKHCIDDFIDTYLQKQKKCKKFLPKNKKKFKYFDYPDYRDAMLSLFSPEHMKEDTNVTNVTKMSDYDEHDAPKCVCRCQLHRSPSTPTDSGLTTKNDRSISSQSITSSIGNFSLDSSTLTAYSESLDQIVSYNSFQDTSFYSTLLQKAAIERITFYVQVHSIQLKCEPSDQEFESKNVITFHCPACKSLESDENGLLRHILSQRHCEKIHFLYKTAYIKKCVSAGKEIQPSTVLNPMKMYRDENKIVCFGDAMYACSLCFENIIVGESVLMAHCSDPEHVERRDKFFEIIE